MIKRIVPILVIGAVVAVALFASQWRTEPGVVSGYLEANEIRVGSRVGGRVAAVLVDEGDEVAADQVLVELEPFDLQAREAEAKAKLAGARAELARLEAGPRAEEIAGARARVARLAAERDRLVAGPRPAEIEAARARAEVARARVTLAQRVHDRTKELLAAASVSATEMDRAVEELEAANGELRARTKELELLQQGTRKEDVDAATASLDGAKAALALLEAGTRKEEIDRAHAAVEAAEATLATIRAGIEELRIRAPTDGVVESLELRPGDLAAPGAPVLSILETGPLWVRAYVPENIAVKTGDELPVTVDAYPDHEFTGEVTFVAREAEFTPSNVQTPEERSKQVFRIKVTLRDAGDRLRPGMSADVHLPAGAGSR